MLHSNMSYSWINSFIGGLILMQLTNGASVQGIVLLRRENTFNGIVRGLIMHRVTEHNIFGLFKRDHDDLR